jgi:hypothetical protein
MGFNRRKMEAQRKAQADAEAAARRAADTQVFRGCGAPDHRLERAPGPANALAVRTDDRRRAFPVGLCPACRTCGIADGA